MEEKVIVKGVLGNVKKIRNTVMGIGLIPAIVMAIYTLVTIFDYLEDNFDESWMVSTVVTYLIVTAIFAIAAIVISLIIYSGLSKISIEVTDKRVFGKAMFGKQVDLPLDSISALGLGMFSSIAVATSSGRITFWGISNRDEIHKIISQLLANRQKENQNVTTIKQEIPQSNADELKKFKELFDSGIITKEEFEAKKKQLLGL